MELAYSFHLGNDGNKSKKAKAKSKNNLSGTTSYANNAIQNARQLSKVNNHDFRKYNGDTEYIYGLRGSGDVVEDVKELYLDMFEKSRLEYNSKQSRPSRMIDDYFKHVSDNEQKDLACEIIIELGNLEFWNQQTLEHKQKMVKVFNLQLKDLETKVPDFKICSAVVHLDEGSPHMHIVGVPIKYNCSRGLSVQVSKSSVFTKDKLEKIQDYMREKCINEYNEIYELDEDNKMELKDKQKGRTFNIHLKDMENYVELVKQTEAKKESMERISNISKNIGKYDDEYVDILLNVEKDKFGNYTFTEKQFNKFLELTNEAKEMAKEFEELRYIYPDLLRIKDKAKYLIKRNYDLQKENDKLIKSNQKFEKQHKSDLNAQDFLKSVIDKQHMDLVEQLVKGANHKDYYTANTYKQVSKKFKENGLISEAEHRVILKPIFGISKSQINQALHKINQEMEDEAEYYKQERDKEMSRAKENDYIS